jgi:hypothetical protein
MALIKVALLLTSEMLFTSTYIIVNSDTCNNFNFAGRALARIIENKARSSRKSNITCTKITQVSPNALDQ